MNKIKKLIKGQFIKNIAIVASGTAMAQVITMLFSPIITRIYGPEAFGVQGVFIAMVGIISPLAALTYPISIVLPKKENEAKDIIYLSMCVSILISLLIAIIIIFFENEIVSVLNIEEISNYLIYLPLIMVSTTFLQVLQQWTIRTKKFNLSAKAAIINAIFLNGSKVGIGALYPVASVLVFITSISNFFHGVLLFKLTRISLMIKNIKTSFRNVKKLAYKYRDFPIYRAPQVMLNAISQSLPIFLLSTFFGTISAGFYTLSRNVLSMPIQLVGKSVEDVFYPRFVEALNKKENLKNLLLKTTVGLALVGFIPFGIIIVCGPWLFEIVFGVDWRIAGEYARWLALWNFFVFINRPTVSAIPVLNLQKEFLIYEIMSIIIRIASLYIGFFYFKSDIDTIILFCIAGVILNAYLIIYTIIKSLKYPILDR